MDKETMIDYRNRLRENVNNPSLIPLDRIQAQRALVYVDIALEAISTAQDVAVAVLEPQRVIRWS